MLRAGLDLSRRRRDVCVLSDEAELVEELAAPPDAGGLRYLVGKVARHGQPVRPVIESMTGARFVQDTLKQLGCDVLIADAQRVKGLAPLACKTDRVDSRVLAVLSHRNLVPVIWPPDPRVRREREQPRFRLHLVKHKSMLKHRIHSTLMTFGHPCPVSDLFGLEPQTPRPVPDSTAVAQDGRRQSVRARLSRVRDRRDRALAACHRCGPPVRAAALDGARDRLGAGLHDRRRDRRHHRFPSARQLVGYTGLCPRVRQSGDHTPRPRRAGACWRSGSVRSAPPGRPTGDRTPPLARRPSVPSDSAVGPSPACQHRSGAQRR